MNDTSNIVSKNIKFGFPHNIGETVECLIFANAKWPNLGKKTLERDTYILQFQNGVFYFKLFPKINNNGGFSPTAIRIKKKSCKTGFVAPKCRRNSKRAILTFNFFSLLKFLNFSVFYMPANLLAYDHIKNTLFNNLWYISSRAGVTYLIKKINYQIISVVSTYNAHIFGFLSG